MSVQEYKLAASPEICLMEKLHPTLNTEHYCTQTEHFCALNFKLFLFLNVFLFNAASSAEYEGKQMKHLKIKKILGFNRIVATSALSVKPSTLG